LIKQVAALAFVAWIAGGTREATTSATSVARHSSGSGA
jgi:hypothetical protein